MNSNGFAHHPDRGGNPQTVHTLHRQPLSMLDGSFTGPIKLVCLTKTIYKIKQTKVFSRQDQQALSENISDFNNFYIIKKLLFHVNDKLLL